MKLFICNSFKAVLMFYLITLYALNTSAQNTYYTACSGSTVTISGAPNQSIKLFSQFTGGVALGIGPTVNSPILTSNSTFYIEDANNAILPRVPVFVAVNPLPSVSASSNQNTFCLGGSTTLTANTTASIENKLTFAGAYDITNSAIKNVNTNGGVNTNFFPDSLILISSGDNGSGNPGYSEYAFRANASGNIRFNWHFTCQDGSIYDFPTIAVNKSAFNYFNGYVLSSGIKNQSGVHVQSVNIGDTVRLRIESVDNLFAAGKCVISGFIAPIPASVSVDWYNSAIGGGSLASGLNYSATPISSGLKNYFAEAISTNGCTNPTRAVTNINVFALPVFSITNPSSICPSETVTLNAIGNNNFVWSDGVVNGVPFTPASTNTYKLIATTSNGCKDSAYRTVVINSAPVINITSSSLTGQLCAGQSVTLTGNGANSYSWSGGIQNGVAFIPIVTSNYVLTGTDTNGCSNFSSILITVNSLPNIIINSIPSSGLVCLGSPATLTASGAISYSWTGDITNGQSFIPSFTNSYTVTGTDANGCSKSVSKTISTTSLPNLSINAIPANSTVCSGGSISLFGSGASTYLWSGGITNGTSFSPTSTTTYILTGTGANGCSDTISKTVLVNSLPIVTILPINAVVCAGDLVSLNGSGANTYTWSGGISNGVPFAASTTTTYVVTGTNANGCSNTASQLLTVKSSPALSINANPINGIVCSGSNVTLSGSGASSYVWSGGILDATPFIPTNSTTYILTGTGSNGCTAIDSFSVSIQSNLNYITNQSLNTISAIQSGANYQWIDCATNAVLANQTNQSFTASQNGSYAVIISQGACMDTSSCVNITSIGLSSVFNKSNMVAIFPNPNIGQFTIQSKTKGDYMILNELGQVLQTFQTKEANNYTVNFIGLGNGIYFLKGKAGGQLVNEKIVVANH